jgi:hypothetical protein
MNFKYRASNVIGGWLGSLANLPTRNGKFMAASLNAKPDTGTGSFQPFFKP